MSRYGPKNAPTWGIHPWKHRHRWKQLTRTRWFCDVWLCEEPWHEGGR